MSSNRVVFYLPDNAVNDATEFYIDIIKKGFEEANFSVVVKNDIKDISRSDKYIFTIEAKHFFILKLKFPSSRIINWFQGVVAEEAFWTTGSYARKYVWHFYEWFALKFSFYNFFVSNAMVDYYKNKLNSDNYFIMPCFNKQYNPEIWYEKKIASPTFVYAGSLAKWQCFEETVQLYKIIEENIPGSFFTILTKEKDKAKIIVEKYNLNNFDIRYVDLDKLDKELLKHRYGFLVRSDHIVNNVATPTKMNSYLSAGIIPIYSDVIFDFNYNFKENSSLISFNNKESYYNVVNKIQNNERTIKLDNFENFKSDLNDIFKKYYNRKYYESQISELVSTFFK